MTHYLFVYGTLAPGQPNVNILENIGGTWQRATVKGKLIELGWGAELGYPGIVLDKDGELIKGFIFSSDSLDKYWSELDDFEGNEYYRVLTNVFIDDGYSINAYIYVLKTVNL